MKILLTGGTGYLGAHLLERFILAGFDVTLLKRSMSSLARIGHLGDHYTAVNVDEVDLASVFHENVLFDCVVHAATTYGRDNETDRTVFKSNLDFAFELLFYAQRYHVKRFINLDTALPAMTNSYSLAKKQFVDWGKYYTIQGAIEYTNLVLQHFFGPEDDQSKFISSVIDKCLRNIDVPLTAGEQRRDFLFIDDMVNAIMLVLQSPIMEPYFEIEVGSGAAITIKEIVEKIHRLSNSNANLLFGAVPYRSQEVMASVADIEALKNLGWATTRTLQQALEYTIQAERIK